VESVALGKVENINKWNCADNKKVQSLQLHFSEENCFVLYNLRSTDDRI